MRRPRSFMPLWLAASLACVGDPQGPASREAAPRQFLTDLVDIMESSSVRRRSIDWTDLRARVMALGDGATTLEQAMPAAQLALTLLADNHSWLRRPDGTVLNYTRSISCATEFVPTVTGVPSDIGYVRILSYGGTSAAAGPYTFAVQNAFRATDSPDLVGWIIDLRGNGGGNMWPMLAALWPFLQGDAGYFMDPDSRWFRWTVSDARAYYNSTLAAEATSPFAPRGTNGRVAVLLDRGVASSGEATAIAFKGRPATRSFGTPTCGLSTGVSTVDLDGGYTFGIATVTMADRDSTLYGGEVPPDEVIGDATAVVVRAIEWIRTGQ